MPNCAIRSQLATLLAAAFAASIALPADSAFASSALFRVKRSWWFGVHHWTNGQLTPPAGGRNSPYSPPAILKVGETLPVHGFSAPKSFIKNTTSHYSCGTRYCPLGYPFASYQASYWNAKGEFRAQNPNAPTTTTTIRFATTMSDPNGPPTGMGEPVTPTTTWAGRYDHSRGGSIVISPGPNRFGGTLRFLYGPNYFYYAYEKWWVQYPPPYVQIRSWGASPLSQQLGTGVEIEIGEVTELTAFRYPVEFPAHKITIGTTSMGGPEYYVLKEHYLITRAPYTTGKVRVWEPNGDTNTVLTDTGYDNRTPAGLLGTISLVHPRLLHVYREYPASTGKPIEMERAKAELFKIDFRLLPEPSGIALLALGCAMLLGLDRARRRERQPNGR